MKTEARLIKALLEHKLLHDYDTIKAAQMNSDELVKLDGKVLVLINKKTRRQRKGSKTPMCPAPESLSHFTFSDGRNSIMFVSRDKDRVGAIADFIIDFVHFEEEEETC
jgi:hypothetical protein